MYFSAIRSLSAEIVRKGFTPRAVGTIDPSATYKPEWNDVPVPLNTRPRWSTAPSDPSSPPAHRPKECEVISVFQGDPCHTGFSMKHEPRAAAWARHSSLRRLKMLSLPACGHSIWIFPRGSRERVPPESSCAMH